jgi:hypothetical protein
MENGVTKGILKLKRKRLFGPFMIGVPKRNV